MSAGFDDLMPGMIWPDAVARRPATIAEFMGLIMARGDGARWHATMGGGASQRAKVWPSKTNSTRAVVTHGLIAARPPYEPCVALFDGDDMPLIYGMDDIATGGDVDALITEAADLGYHLPEHGDLLRAVHNVIWRPA